MHKGIRIGQDGRVSIISWTNSNSYETLREACTLDKGYIEATHLEAIKGTMWCDEEGKWKNGYTMNVVASKLWPKLLGYPTMDWLMGPVVITGDADAQGNTLGLSEKQILQIQELVKDVV